MPNDAKLGMVAGVALVLAVAVVFFYKDAAPAAGDGPRAVTPAPRRAVSRDTPAPPRPEPPAHGSPEQAVPKVVGRTRPAQVRLVAP